jgi:hypothetical protein
LPSLPISMPVTPQYTLIAGFVDIACECGYAYSREYGDDDYDDYDLDEGEALVAQSKYI